MLPFPVPGNTLFCLNQNIPSHLYMKGLARLTLLALAEYMGPYYLAACHNMSQQPTPNPPGFHWWQELETLLRRDPKISEVHRFVASCLCLNKLVDTWDLRWWWCGSYIYIVCLLTVYITVYIYKGRNLMGSYCIHKYSSRCLEGVLVSDDWFQVLPVGMKISQYRCPDGLGLGARFRWVFFRSVKNT